MVVSLTVSDSLFGSVAMTGSVNRALVLLVCRCSIDNRTPHDISHVPPSNVSSIYRVVLSQSSAAGKMVKIGGDEIIFMIHYHMTGGRC